MNEPAVSSRFWQGVAVITLVAAVFVADTITNLEIAAAVFYIVPIMVSVRLLSRRHVVALAVLCVMLTITSSVLTTAGAREAGFINLGISVAAILVTTYLALRMLSSEASYHHAREQLLRVSRITKLGELTTSIAHEVNQPLAAVVASAAACRRWLTASPPNTGKARESINRIVEEANRASEVISRVRRLTRQEQTCKEWLDVNSAVAECVALARAEIHRNGLNLVLCLGDELPQIYADRVQIHQVLSNLVLNAIEAQASVDRSRRTLEIDTHGGPLGTVEIEVGDNGPGLPDQAPEQLFQAFWTTKEGGTGLGLTISRTIVEAHGGHLEFCDTRKGARIRMSLPSKGPRR